MMRLPETSSYIDLMKVRPVVLLLPLLLLAMLVIMSLSVGPQVTEALESVHQILLRLFGPLYSIVVLIGLVLLAIVYFSPLGRVVIGGPDATPTLSRPTWFFIVLCTTVAAGILFWATAEPVFHFNQPPPGSGIIPGSPEARSFALSSLYLHWTFLPYSLYTVAGLVFALVYHNRGASFQVGSMLVPLLGTQGAGKSAGMVDSICLFCLVAGMSSSMGSALLTLSGGYARYSGQPSGPLVLGVVALLITLAMGISAVTGLHRGIRILSYSNALGFVLLSVWAACFGPIGYVLEQAGPAVHEFTTTIIPRSLSLGMDRAWSENWTVFYWSNWLAWTPVTAVFLGRLARGYDVRTFIRYNLVYPSLFSLGWLTLFGGYALQLDGQSGNALHQLLKTSGAESIVFGVLDTLPLAIPVGLFFLALVFLSFVTSGDSLVSAMGGLTTRDLAERKEEAPAAIKFLWSGVIGITAWFMVSNAGLGGIRIISNLGGFPALLLYVMIILGLIRMVFHSIRNRNSKESESVS